VANGRFTTRQYGQDDATAVDDLLQQGFAGFEDDYPGSADALELGAARLAQTGNRLLVAEDLDGIAGVVRWRDEDGVGWLDLLVSGVTRAGRALVRAVEQTMQDRGIRFLRMRVPGDGPLAEYFGRMGYLPVAHEGGQRSQVVLEKRLPLLTVREQRRSDAAAIGALTGEDPWPFEQGVRPGWFVLADGERVVGAIAVRDPKTGVAEVCEPALDDAYRGRGLEVWMLERAAIYAETNGFHTIQVAATKAIDGYERDLEERRWFKDGDLYVKRL
jgi:GNAT superfamily N-acetyltransferase